MCKAEAAFLRTKIRRFRRSSATQALRQPVGDGGLVLSSSNNIYGTLSEFLEKTLSETLEILKKQ